MTELRIPWPDGAAWQQTIALDRRIYRLTARWNEIANAWFMDIATRDGSALLNGVKVTQGVLIGARIADNRLPPGYFVVVGNDECGCTPRRDDMAENARLIYVSAIY
jgi:hypothetical protein